MLIPLICTSQHLWAEESIHQFYVEAKNHGVSLTELPYEVRVAPLGKHNGRIELLNNGTLLIVIDHDFYNYYHNKSQIRRLTFHLMAKFYKINSNKGIMDEDKVYYKLKQKQIVNLFKNVRTNSIENNITTIPSTKI